MRLFSTRFTRIDVLFEPRDIWVGVYWTFDTLYASFYVCLLPFLPLRVKRLRRVNRERIRRLKWANTISKEKEGSGE